MTADANIKGDPGVGGVSSVVFHNPEVVCHVVVLQGVDGCGRKQIPDEQIVDGSMDNRS